MNLIKFVLIVIVALTASAFFPISAQPGTQEIEGVWAVTIRHNSFGEMRLTLNFENKTGNTFNAYSNRKAVRNMLGATKATVAKIGAASKNHMFRTGALCGIENGVYTVDSAGIRFEGLLYIPMGQMKIKGNIQQNKLSAMLTHLTKNTTVGYVDGIPATKTGPIDNYAGIVDSLLRLYGQKIYNTEVLNTKAWRKFEARMRSFSYKATSDLELISAFYVYSEKLPFSHKALYRVEKAANAKKTSLPYRAGQITLEEKPYETAVLRVQSFYCSAHEMDSFMQIVLAKNYRNLIVDIRGNPGGTLEGGITLAGYLVQKTEPTGVYLTQAWFKQHSEPPTAEAMEAIPAFSKADLGAFTRELEEKGIVVLKAKPGPRQFTGNLYLLTDRKSASACEPLTWNLKNSGRALVVGEPTAGAMLSAESYPVCNGFIAVIPNADYYTPAGNRLDFVGVKPHVEVKSAEALDYVLQKIEEGSR